MQVTLKIQRFHPERDGKPHWEEHQVEVEPTDRLLDALEQIKDQQDGSLAFRRSCAYGICGSDVMTVNHVNRLACKVLMKNLGSKVTVEPLRGFPVIKDLVVDMDLFFEKYRSVKPYLINDEPDPPIERYQTPNSEPGSMIQPSASCAEPVPVRVPHSGETGTISDRRHRPGPSLYL